MCKITILTTFLNTFCELFSTNLKKAKKTFKKVLTKRDESGIIYKLSRRAEARSLKIEQQTNEYKL